MRDLKDLGSRGQISLALAPFVGDLPASKPKKKRKKCQNFLI
jgi:hypothetical protein